jgi:adenylate kinase family enzyme
VGKSAGWCLDGFPSTEEEAKLLKDRGIPVSKLIVIDTPDQDLIRLAVGRRIDLESHTVFHRKSPRELNHFISWCGIAHDVTWRSLISGADGKLHLIIESHDCCSL